MYTMPSSNHAVKNRVGKGEVWRSGKIMIVEDRCKGGDRVNTGGTWGKSVPGR